jgi:hypothetical protein
MDVIDARATEIVEGFRQEYYGSASAEAGDTAASHRPG